jgi:hypothetical protein
MKRTDVALSRPGVRPLLWIPLLVCIAWLALGSLVRAQGGEDHDSKDEVFEKVDPYTGGEPAAVDRAGYFSFGPFPWCEGVRTSDIEETLGRRLLWVETAHFKIGSSLATYKYKGDKREEKRLAAELEQLKTKFERFTPPKGKLDPWLRLHLYAQRVEAQYASFVERFKIEDKDFLVPGKQDAAPAMGNGPFLGQAMKFTVLITEKQASIGRFTQRFLGHPSSTSVREFLPGGSMLTGISADSLREFGFDLDAALYCTLASELSFNIMDGYRNSFAAPFWFKQGYAHMTSRSIDERWALYAVGTMRSKDDDSWRWEPRVFGLVTNGFMPSWKEMTSWRKWEDVNAQGHMVVWSRVSWLLSQKNADLHALLTTFTDPLPKTTDEDRARVVVERQPDALKQAFGKEVRELEEAWRVWVLKTYPKK